jgi:hypothetical protein
MGFYPDALTPAGPISGVTVSGTAAANDTIEATSSTAGTWALGLFRQASTAVAGYSLPDSTGNIITWTAPSDGLLHRVQVYASLHVTSAETGGIIIISYTLPDGSTAGPVLFNGGLSAATYQPFALPVVIEAGSTFAVQQNTALSVGAALLWAEIWAS